MFYVQGAAKNIPSTLIGDGYFMNCGPEKLRLNTAYVIFGKSLIVLFLLMISAFSYCIATMYDFQ